MKNNYGQVEPNHLSAQRNGQIYAQLPAAAAVENGMFVKYDYVNNQVNLTGAGEWMLAFSEVKIYDARQSAADFRIEAGEYPRLFKTSVGDIFTTNKVAGLDDITEAGATLKVGTDGILVAGSDDNMEWKVVKVYTMPDGSKGVKVQRVK